MPAIPMDLIMTHTNARCLLLLQAHPLIPDARMDAPPCLSSVFFLRFPPLPRPTSLSYCFSSC